MQKTYKPFILLIIIFVLPLIASGLLFRYHAYFHLKTVNHGTLISSPIDVSYLYLNTENAQQKKWRIMYVADKKCEKPCQESFHQLQQVQKALGKDSDRVRLIFINNDDKQLEKLKTVFVMNNNIYLIDPQGHLFMYYSGNVDPMNVLKDLQRVLEVSQIG